MKARVLTLLVCFGLFACNDLTGSLTLQQPLNVVDKDGKSVMIPTGTYQSSFNYNQDKRELKLKVKDVATNGDTKDVQLKLEVPADVQVPRDNGAFVVPGTEIGQSFDINGKMDTETATSNQESGFESCSYTSYEYVCGRVCGGYHYPNCHEVCGYRNVVRWGSRPVTFHYVSTTESVDLQFVDASSKAVLGTNAVTHTESNQKVYDSAGDCLR